MANDRQILILDTTLSDMYFFGNLFNAEKKNRNNKLNAIQQ